MTEQLDPMPVRSPGITAGIANDHLRRLSTILITAGWDVSTLAAASNRPCIHVVNPYMRALNENVFAAPDTQGRWLFWWSWGDPIADVGDITKAATRIRRVLALPAAR